MSALLSALEPVARFVVATLFNNLWESALLALATWTILRFVPNVNASTRYIAWVAALVASVVLPILTTLSIASVQVPGAHSRTSSVQSHGTVTAPVAVTSTTRHRAVTETHVSQPGTSAASVPASTSAPFQIPRLRFSVPPIVGISLFALWSLAAFALLARLGLSLWRLEHLKSDALPLDLSYREHMARWQTANKGARDVRLCISEHVEVPVAVGLFDSMILIPSHLLETLSQGEIDQISLHELAHLRRGDDWTNSLQRIVQAMLFFNPAIAWIAQQLDLEREVACDDWVLAHTSDVRPYAFCLTKMAEVTAWPHRALAAPGVFVTRKSLSIRVERLLRSGRNIRTSISFGATGTIAAALIVLFFVVQTIAPSIAFTLPQTESGVSKQANPSHAAVPKTAAHATENAGTATPSQVRSLNTPESVHPLPQTQRVALATAAPEAVPSAEPSAKPSVNLHLQNLQGLAGLQSLQSLRSLRNIPNVHVSVVSSPHSPHPPSAEQVAANISGAASCTGCDFSGAKFSGRNMHGANLTGSDFSNADLSNADFSNANLSGVDFSSANLRGTNFSNANMSGCDLSGAEMTGANFDGARLSGCNIDVAHLSPAQTRMFLARCTGCDFGHANLRGQDLRGLHLSGIDLSGADLRDADLSGAQFSGVDLEHVKLDGAKLNGTVFSGCDFSGVDLRNVDLSHAQITGSSMSNAILRS